MAKPAVPDYLGQTFDDTPPGHRFTLYGAFWEPDQGWQRVKNVASANLKRDFGPLTPQIKKLRDALRDRQAHVAAALGDAIWHIAAQSSAPFVTGTGIEHPLENGMAFLNPYGLPYLAGSGVKGVLRRAAEELRHDVFDEGATGWDQPAIDALFGREPKSGDTEHTRGALSFWDVFPQCDRLAVDIMTPHYGDYYQGNGNATPHDSGQPNPILFLTVPPGSGFGFFVQCDPAMLPESLKESWQDLLESAFRHAFDWLGFGAKTAVGYGAMHRDLEAEQQRRAETAQRVRQAAEAALSSGQKMIVELRRWFDEDQTARRKESGGRLANRLNELLKDGLPWPAAEREDLAQLAEAIYGYLDWGSGKKKQERKAKIQQLREGAT